ncbi:MAG: nucleotidyl transferase AbiEii/AbiGii toxin family protein [Sulfuricella sp.]
MNLAIRGIEADFGPEQADTFRRDLHKDLKAQFVIANPPFNDSDWHRADDDVRWQYGVPPKGNANFAWVQHFIHHLAPDGYAGFVLANGSMSSNQSGEGDIRKAIIEADLVDCMVALPGQLFYSTQIPVCLWFLTKNKLPSPAGGITSDLAALPPSRMASSSIRGAGGEGARRDRRKQTLFIDARKLGTLIDRVHRELTDADIAKITSTYHAWRGDPPPRHSGESRNPASYIDIPGFCKSATTAEIATHGYPRASVVAEKLEAIVSLGMANSRMKDYFDLRALAHEGVLDAQLLGDAIAATFQRRGMAVPVKVPLGLSDEFAHDAAKRAQWKAFLGKNRLDAPMLDEVIGEVRHFVTKPLKLARQRKGTP